MNSVLVQRASYRVVECAWDCLALRHEREKLWTETGPETETPYDSTMGLRDPQHIATARRVSLVTLALLVLATAQACSHLSPYRDLLYVSPARELPDSPKLQIVLVGDAGDPGESLLSTLQAWIADSAATRNVVAFLGDNAYPEGVTNGRREEAERLLDRQIDTVAATRATAIFIPGNHDWANGGPDGLAARG